MSDELKAGARNNRSDKQRIRDIRKAARSIHDTTVEMEPDDEDKPTPIDEALGIGEGAGKASGLDMESADMPGARVIAVKLDSGDWALDVLGNPWGGPHNGRDTDGEFFDAQTKFHEDKYPLPPVVYYHGFDGDSGKPMGAPQYIGRTVGRTVKPDGVWYRVLLDKASEWAKRVWDAAQRGIARASTGSSHLHRVDTDGHIREWPVTELSIFDAVGKRQPANSYAVAVPAMKAVYQAAGLPLPPDIELEPEAEPTSDGTPEQNGDAAHQATGTKSSSQEIDMEPNEVQKMVAESVAAALKADRDANAAQAESEKARAAEIEAAVKAEREKWESEDAAGNRLPGGAPYVAKFASAWKYDNLDHGDLAFMLGLLSDAKRAGQSKNGATEEGLKALAIRLAEDTDPAYTSARTAMKMAGLPMKANELNYSTQVGYGDEWVGVAYSSQIWEHIRQQTPVVGRIPTIVVPQGSESIIIPLEGTPPTFYKVAQATSQSANPGPVIHTVTTSKLGTAQTSLTVGKMGASVIYTGELEEDSMVPWVSELRSSLEREGAEVLEHIVIDGDTATAANTNINDIAGTPAGTEPFLLFNGFRKLALVTNTANSRDGGPLDILDYLLTLQLMGVAGASGLDRSAISFIQSATVGWSSLALAEVKTQDIFSNPTLENGVLTRLWGREVITTANMHRANQDATYGLKANTAGKVDLDTPANNVAGAILAVRWDQWRLGYKRRMTIETIRIPQADATQIVALMRVGMVYRDTEAAAISFNIT